jgi:1,4-alpha-glucan branching enzyme
MARNVKTNRGRAFTLAAPTASSVLLAGDFTQWEKQPIRLRNDGNGLWTATVKLSPGTHRYRFLVDGKWQDDPACADRVANTFGSQDCVCQVC